MRQKRLVKKEDLLEKSQSLWVNFWKFLEKILKFWKMFQKVVNIGAVEKEIGLRVTRASDSDTMRIVWRTCSYYVRDNVQISLTIFGSVSIVQFERMLKLMAQKLMKEVFDSYFEFTKFNHELFAIQIFWWKNVTGMFWSFLKLGQKRRFSMFLCYFE